MAKISSEKSLEMIYDHYKDSFLNQKANENVRNKLFIFLCITILVLMLMVVYPNNVYETFQSMFVNYFKVDIKFELKVIELFNWFILSYLTVRYYQINANIEKNYNYIHKLENALEGKYKLPIYREGKNYLDKYPFFLTFSFWFYKYIFPVLYVLCIIIKLCFYYKSNLTYYFIIPSFLIGFLLIIINISYIIFNYKIMKGGKDDGET